MNACYEDFTVAGFVLSRISSGGTVNIRPGLHLTELLAIQDLDKSVWCYFGTVILTEEAGQNLLIYISTSRRSFSFK